MQVSEGMSTVVLTVGPRHTLRDAARAMAERKVGAAIVLDPEQPGLGIVTERDLLDSIGAGQSPDSEYVADHLSSNLTFAVTVNPVNDPPSIAGLQSVTILEDTSTDFLPFTVSPRYSSGS